LVHDEFMAFGTSGGEHLTNTESALALRTLRLVLRRLGIELAPQFRDLDSFKAYWLRQGASGSYAARRTLLADLFDPVHARLMALADRALASTLADPISPHAVTGWPKVDEELSELRRLFGVARTTQDHRDVGNRCVAVLEALGRVAYNPERHLRAGESVPSPERTKQRLQRVIEDGLPGPTNEDARGLAVKAIALAHHVKHQDTPSRRDAGIAGDAVILLCNIVRRLSEGAATPSLMP